MNITNSENESPDEDKNHGHTSRSQGSGIFKQQTAQVCWDRFLPVRTIRVLLVENDDCTRQVVTALLRKCNYEVVDAANGVQAWKILEDLNTHIDIVLTEVVMPCLSGIGLLLKIMSHKTRNNIPIIMMSSHDSMGLVFKCLSKGAVDFLVKPIRKNELRNLWQHVWRRCHSSSGSASESGTQTKKPVKSNGSEKSGNNASDDGEHDASNGLSPGDESDDGSGAQSSWTKQDVEVNSSQALSPMNQIAERPDSTCAQVIRSNAEHTDYNKVQLDVATEGRGHKLPDTIEKWNDVETIVHRNVVPKSENPVEGQSNPTVRECESNRFDININASDDSKKPNLELSLKRLRGAHDTGGSVQDERYISRRSEQSAFSRYNTSTSIFKSPNAITGSSYVLDTCTEAAKRESVGEIHIFSTDHIINQSSNRISNNNLDMGSTTNRIPKDKSEAASMVNGLHPSSPLRHVKNDLRYSLLPKGMKASSNHVDTPHCRLTNVLGGPMDGNINMGNCSLNRSASGSNHGSNGQNGSSNAVNAVENNNNNNNNNAETDVGKSGSGGASGGGSGNKVDVKKLTQREAALIKFRQKRKERCFKKKVRYQNRKKLAEQRLRVGGQFVKQTGADISNRSGDE